MHNLKKINFLIGFLTLSSLLTLHLMGSAGLSFAQGEDMALSQEEEKEMEAKIAELEEKISKYRSAINTNRQKARTLKTEIAILDDEVAKSELEIQRINLIIFSLNTKIIEKESQIREIERHVDLEKTALGELIREISIYDDVSFVEIVLGQDKLSDFLADLRSLENFQNQIQYTLDEIRVLKSELEREKEILNQEKQEQIALKYVQQEQRNEVDGNKRKKETLLQQTKGQEDLFAQLVSKTKKDIEAIKGRLYFLKGIISDGQLSFGEAYQYAKYAAIYTGIRPAFLLAILSKESGLGKNVGTGTWRIDMKPTQRPYFLQICEKLGINPDDYQVSKKAWYGWGGAMGPAQFLPATWLGYEARIAEITGNNPPSPWNIKDAFVASALYLVNKGANNHDYYIEWKSAMIYLAGSNWNKPYLSFYGDQVMVIATQFQEEIDILEGK